MEDIKNQYIVISVGIENYGVNILDIDSIIRLKKITRIPKTKPYYKGVINLRGEILPVMSIKKRFGIDNEDYTDKSRIIIIKDDQDEKTGIIVDEVKDVVNIPEEDVDMYAIDSMDELAKFTKGVAKDTYNNRLITLLNIENIMKDDNDEDNDL
ncbi:purine-binding chemotaxis protein CheW [Lachnospiraceae bacterium RM5]|nr:purine-binding chemotaxis protein CheW [Lachnospiraceae bacterium RM5]